MKSPHILIDDELENMAKPSTPLPWSVMVLKLITELMTSNRITIDEYNHYCGRLDKVLISRKGAA